MTTYYVSNADQNEDAGWGVAGIDDNDGTTKATPFATVARACSAAEAGDVVMINPTDRIYVECSGDGHLDIGNAAVVTGDFGMAGSGVTPQKVPVIQAASAASQVIAIPTRNYPQMLACLAIDGQNVAHQVGVAPQRGRLILRQVNFMNMAGACNASFATGSCLTLDKVTVDDSCVASPVFSMGGLDSLTVLGGVFRPTPSQANSPVFYLRHVTLASLVFRPDEIGTGTLFASKGGLYLAGAATRIVDGGRNYCVGDVLVLAGGVALDSCRITVTSVDAGGTINGVTVTEPGRYAAVPAMPNDVGGGGGSGARLTVYTATSPAIFMDNTSKVGSFVCKGARFDAVPQAICMDGTVNSWKIQGCSFDHLTSTLNISGVGFTCSSGELSDNSFIGRGQFIKLTAPDHGQGCFSRNNMFHSVAGAIRQSTVYWVFGREFTSTNDRVVVDVGAYGGIVGGGDGIVVEATHLQTSRLSSINCGDDASRKYVGTAWTTVPTTSGSRATHLSLVQIEIRKIGNGQEVTCTVHADDAGAPGIPVGRSDTIDASALETSPQFINFSFMAPVSIAPNTRYHLVFTTPRIDSDNYVGMSLSGNVRSSGPGNLEHVFHSADGSSWVAEPSHGFEILIGNGFYGHTPTYIGTTVIYGDPDDPHETETINTGPCLNPSILGGRFINAGYTLSKNSIGGTIAGCFQLNSRAKSAAGLYAKAARGMKIVNNTIVVMSAYGVAFGGDTLRGVNHVSAQNCMAMNNVIVVPMNANANAAPYYVHPTFAIGLVIDYNCVYRADGTVMEAVQRHDEAAWHTVGYDRHGLFTDPQLPNATAAAFDIGDVTPPRHSPVIGSGADLRAIAPVDIAGRPFMSNPSMGCVEVMTGELLAMAMGAGRAYAVIRRSNGLVWNGASFGRYEAAKLSTYAVEMWRQGGSGIWLGSMPELNGVRPPRGRYIIDYRLQVGQSPRESDAMADLGKFTIDWDGSAEIIDKNSIGRP